MMLLKRLRPGTAPKVLASGPSSLALPDRLAKGLGWFSIGLGLAKLLAPRRLTDAVGMDGMEPLVRAYGARDIASGMLTLSVDKKLGLWSRVCGDALDVAALIPALDRANPKRGNAQVALAVALGVTALDVIAAQRVHSRHRRRPEAARDYGGRSGFPSGIERARSSARSARSGPDERATKETFTGSA